MGLRYVWERWNLVQTDKYYLFWNALSINILSFETKDKYSSYSFNSSTGEIEFAGELLEWSTREEIYYTEILWYENSHGIHYPGSNFSRVNQEKNEIDAAYTTKEIIYSQGTTSYGNISSSSPSAYPNNSYSGSNWYVYKGSDSIDPTISYSPETLKGGELVTIIITPSTSNTYGGTISYKIEYQFDSDGWVVLNNSTTETQLSVSIPKGTQTFIARVTASDNMGFTSTAVVGETVEVNNNTAPILNLVEISDTNLGNKNEPFSFDFTVTDAEGGNVLMGVSFDDETPSFVIASDVLSRPTLQNLSPNSPSEVITISIDEYYFIRLTNGDHILNISLTDNDGAYIKYEFTFTKALYTTTLTLSEPMEADALVTKCNIVLNSNITDDNEFQFLVSNNPYDSTPTWEDMSNYVKNGWNYQFTNNNVSSSQNGFNFKLTVSRNNSNILGYITSISGGFE